MLTVENVSFAYGKRSLFADVSFELKAGELIHISGPNGVGKSTLMAVIAGLKPIQSGSIIIDQNEDLDRRAWCEYLPAEGNGLFPKLNAIDNLETWSRLRGHDASETSLRNELKTWNLDHALFRGKFPVEKFSTGMKRRLALSRLSLSKTKCWLLDEPIYGLDTQAIEQFIELLGKHLNSGGSALLVSHETEPFKDLVTSRLELA